MPIYRPMPKSYKMGGLNIGFDEDPQEQSKREANKAAQTKKATMLAEREIKAPFEIMSAEDRQLIQEMRKIPNILSRVKELSIDVPEDRTGAFLYKRQIDTPIINELTVNKNQRALKTNLELLIQTVVKSFQGARPSDRDQEIMNRAISAIGEGRGNFNQALNELGGLAKRQAEMYSSTASKGWRIDKKVIDDLIDMPSLLKLDVTVNEGGGESGQNTPKKVKLEW